MVIISLFYSWYCHLVILTLCDPVDCSLPGSSVHGDSPGKNTGVGCRALLQGIFPTQGRSLPPCRLTLYHLSHLVSLRILEWVAYPFSRGSSQPRNWTGISCIAGRFFTSWGTREALFIILFSYIFSVCSICNCFTFLFMILGVCVFF